MKSMKKYLVLVVDVAIFSASVVLAWLLRMGVEDGLALLGRILPYLMTSALTAVVIFPFFGLHRHLFKYFSLGEFYYVLVAVSLSILSSVLISFLYFRLESVPRSLPFLHWVLAAGGLAAFRVVLRGLQHRAAPHGGRATAGREAVLVVGFTPVAELFLRSVELLGRDRIHVVGILDENPHLLGSRLRLREVLGHPQDLAGILVRYRVHGVNVTRIVLALEPEELSQTSRQVIERLESTGQIRTLHFRQLIDDALEPCAGSDREVASFSPTSTLVRNAFSDEGLYASLSGRIDARQRRYAIPKRAFDIMASMLLLLLAAPLLLVLTPAIRLFLGKPVFFWQERPGREGRTFRLYKLRTLRHAVDDAGNLLPEEQRQTPLGHFLRRYRLDELPQCINVLKGDMSLVGPRPLLPVDLPFEMPELVALRSRVRPGITGWAQVCGGNHISPRDKAVLDVWYACNMSAVLDWSILWRTVRMLLKGESIDDDAIRRAWRELNLPRAATGAEQEPRHEVHSPNSLARRGEAG